MQHFSYLGCPLVTHFLSQRKMKTFSQGFFEDVKATEASAQWVKKQAFVIQKWNENSHPKTSFSLKTSKLVF